MVDPVAGVAHSLNLAVGIRNIILTVYKTVTNSSTETSKIVIYFNMGPTASVEIGGMMVIPGRLN